MEAWKKEILNSDFGEQIRREYRKLLSVGKSDEEAETLVVDYFRSKLNDNKLMMGHFWIVLALCEWESGRLTKDAEKNARYWATYPWEQFPKIALETLLKTLDSPMPPKKKVRLPSYVSHCPWPVGSLLAYRIISSEHPHVTQSPFYGKYVLLRIIKIKKQPITQLAPEAAWNESMLVGLYNWIGDTIPDSETGNRLQFTAVSVQKPMLHTSAFRNIPNGMGPELVQQVMARTTQPRVETCCDLDWKCLKPQKTADVFTYLGCDPTFAQEVLPFFRTDICDYAMSSSHSFDAMLVNRFTQLEKESTL